MNGAPLFLVNGVRADSLPAADRGLHYGDGLFETIAVRDGRARHLDRHLARLADGCTRLGIAVPEQATLRGEVATLCAGGGDAVLKLIVTRGPGGRGYRPSEVSTPTRVLARYPWPRWSEAWARDGVAVRWCDTRLARQSRLAGLKHLNRLEQVLARAEWGSDDEWQEGLMCDADGTVVEGTRSNLFVVRGGELATPSLTLCGVAGIIRGMLIEHTGCAETTLDRDAVEAADELMLCNSVIGLWPVRRLGDRMLPAPGPVTVALQQWLAAQPG